MTASRHHLTPEPFLGALGQLSYHHHHFYTPHLTTRQNTTPQKNENLHWLGINDTDDFYDPKDEHSNNRTIKHCGILILFPIKIKFHCLHSLPTSHRSDHKIRLMTRWAVQSPAMEGGCWTENQDGLPVV